MPSIFALSARLAEMPEPGQTMTPIGSGQGVKDVGDGAVDGFVFGQRPHVGLAGARLVAVELLGSLDDSVRLWIDDTSGADCRRLRTRKPISDAQRQSDASSAIRNISEG